MTCKYPKCKREKGMIYLGKSLCTHHFDTRSREDLQKKLNVVRRERDAQEQEEDSDPERRTVLPAHRTGNDRGNRKRYSGHPIPGRPEHTKRPESKGVDALPGTVKQVGLW